MDSVLWRDVPGYNGKYQASTDGQVRRVYPSGKTRLLHPHHKSTMRGSQRLIVKLTADKPKEEILMQVIAKTFLKKPAGDVVLYHIDGSQYNNALINLAYISRHKLGKMTGAKSNRKSVVKIDQYGNDVEYYSSARQAGKQNYMSYQTIIDRCNGVVKRGFAPDGYEYAWDDSETSRRKAIERISK